MEKNLLLFFDRPCEPIFIPKGEQKVHFGVPASYLAEEYQPMAERILFEFGEKANSTIPITQAVVPNMNVPLSVGRREPFSLFIPKHRKAAAQLTELFMGMQNVSDLMCLAAYCRDRVNPQMFAYTLSVTILHRPDTKHLTIPHLWEIFPGKFWHSDVFDRAKERSNVVPIGSRTPIEIPVEWTASAKEPESRLAYFREDIGINLHHWHWHLVYPFDGPMNILNKDRRGELFYYMHNQVMARYNTERLCNGLTQVPPIAYLRRQLYPGYFPKLDSTVAGRAWPGRLINMTLKDLNREVDELHVHVSDLETWRDRILEAIRSRTVLTATGTVQLDDQTGIDVLGNMIEASLLSPNQSYYGDIHNAGHDLIAFVHDPDHRYLESFAVMGDNTTAMRDPIFYKWHAFIDWLFHQYLDSLTPYTEQELDFPGVTVQDIKIISSDANPNTLNTHWSKTDIDLSRGLDFTPRGAILVRVQHLDHNAFTYSFTINNANNQEVLGTVRVFIAPKFDVIGRQFFQSEQRMLMVELDKFTTRLKSGQNIVTRHSTESSVTIPFESTFQNVDPENSDVQNFEASNFCGCGWPQHMLIPMGTENGYAMDLFVMVSDYEQDKIDQAEPTGCRDGVSFCGLKDRKYPDKRGMGYPFDRKARAGVQKMNEFLTPNMRLQPVTIRFSNTIQARQSGGNRSVNRQ